LVGLRHHQVAGEPVRLGGLERGVSFDTAHARGQGRDDGVFDRDEDEAVDVHLEPGLDRVARVVDDRERQLRDGHGALVVRLADQLRAVRAERRGRHVRRRFRRVLGQRRQRLDLDDGQVGVFGLPVRPFGLEALEREISERLLGRNDREVDEVVSH
jgi:hypothetical protein